MRWGKGGTQRKPSVEHDSRPGTFSAAKDGLRVKGDKRRVLHDIKALPWICDPLVHSYKTYGYVKGGRGKGWNGTNGTSNIH